MGELNERPGLQELGEEGVGGTSTKSNTKVNRNHRLDY